MDMQNLLFVGGCPRSGTTLVKRILDAHSQIYCGPEFGQLPNLCGQYATMQKGIRAERISAYATEAELQAAFREFILRFAQTPLKKSGKRYFAEKTPDNLLVFYTLFELFPEARFIHVVRNPLDVVASYLKVGRRGDKESVQFPQFHSAHFAARTWLKKVNTLWGHKDGFDDPAFRKNYLEIKYEDLVRQPETEIAKLCAWLGVAFEPEQVISSSGKKLEGDPASLGGVFYTEAEYYRPIDDSAVGSYQQHLTRAEIRDVVNVAGPLMVEKGYLSQQELVEYQAERRKAVGNEPGVKDQGDPVKLLGKLLADARDRNAKMEECLAAHGLSMAADGGAHTLTSGELLKLAFSRLLGKKEQQ